MNLPEGVSRPCWTRWRARSPHPATATCRRRSPSPRPRGHRPGGTRRLDGAGRARRRRPVERPVRAAGPSGQGGPPGRTAGQGGPEARTAQGHSAQGHSGQDRFTYDPGPPGSGPSRSRLRNPAPGSDVTGQWSIPVAEGDLPDESGEFTTSALAEQWAPPRRSPRPPPFPAAPAPWATQSIGQPWGPGVPGVDRITRDRLRARFRPGAGWPGTRPARGARPRHARAGAARAEPPSPAEPHWRTEQEAYREAAAVPSAPELREHPQPGTEGAVRPAPGPGGPAEAAEGARRPEAPHEAREAPRRPTGDDPSEPAAAPEAAEHPEPSAPPRRTARPAEPLPGAAHDDHPLATYVLSVNGTDRPVTDAWIGESLLYVLRERLGLAGAKDGCSQGECGACNVQVDGLVASCLVPAVTTAGSEVRTVEGLAQDGQPSDVQRALARCGAVQCGFCVPGMAMTVHDLLEGNPEPSRLETRQALCGNLCRCSGYRGVVEAVQEVVAEREAHAEHAEHTESDRARTRHGPG
ncbi:2Fe-2S iron-sulfur cluster-binding protein [Streptomyces sp. INA 01156]